MLGHSCRRDQTGSSVKVFKNMSQPVLLCWMTLQEDFLVNIGSCDVYGHVLHIKHKDQDFVIHGFLIHCTDAMCQYWELEVFPSLSQYRKRQLVPSERRVLVCLGPHSGAVQMPAPKLWFPRWNCSNVEQMNSTVLTLGKLHPADTEHKNTKCFTSHLRKYILYAAFTPTFLISSGMAVERFVLRSVWNDIQDSNMYSGVKTCLPLLTSYLCVCHT